MTSPIIDVHCHTFNADDLPVRGFLHHCHLYGKPLGTQLAQLLDLVVQTSAPGYHDDLAKLDALLVDQPPFEGAFELATPTLPEEFDTNLERQVEEALTIVQGRNPELLQELSVQVAAAEAGPTAEEGFFDLPGTARRLVRWVKLFGQSRINLAGLLVDNFQDRVDLFCPLLVDLDQGLGDVPKTTPRQQMVLHEKVSRLSMIGRLPGGGRARLHPFAAFDPRRQLKAERARDIETPMQLLETAIERYGFVGVKLYPSMGWQPIGNDDKAIDRVLREFYGWCQVKDVPVTAHCNLSNIAADSYKLFNSPEHWIKVLEEFGELRLNLGHLGGFSSTHDDGQPNEWPKIIARATTHYPHLYGDVGCHPVFDKNKRSDYAKRLHELFARGDTDTLKKRIMFGSDWFMLAVQKEHDKFLEQYEALFGEEFPDVVDDFLGGNARRFLGFDQPPANNHNSERLRRRYDAYAPNRVPDWLAA